MTPIVIGLAAALFLVNVMLWALVLKQRQEIQEMREARAEWWDAYPAALDENARAHALIEELQREAQGAPSRPQLFDPLRDPRNAYSGGFSFGGELPYRLGLR
jgi:hypothetical protein